MTVTSALRKLRQMGCEFRASLGYILRDLISKNTCYWGLIYAKNLWLELLGSWPQDGGEPTCDKKVGRLSLIPELWAAG